MAPPALEAHLSVRSRVGLLVLLPSLFGCIDLERVVVSVAAMSVAATGLTLLVLMGARVIWRRSRQLPLPVTSFARALRRTRVALSAGTLAVVTFYLLKELVDGVPLALYEYVGLYAAPLLWALLLVLEAYDLGDRRKLHIAIAIGAGYLFLFAIVCTLHWPGPRIPQSNIVEVAVSRQSVCERYEDGEVLCLGFSLGVSGRWSVPVDAPPAAKLHLGYQRACLRTLDDELWCWSTPGPVQVEGLAGPLEEVFVVRGGLVVQQGGAYAFIPGDGDELPHAASGDIFEHGLDDDLRLALDAADEVAARDRHVCLVRESQVECTSDEAGTLERRPDLSPAEHVAVSSADSCAWQGRTVRCDGDELYGGEFHFDAPVAQVVVGRWHACALSGDAVYCWGRGRAGVLGTGTEDQSEPTRVELGPVTQLTGWDDFTCVLETGDMTRTLCWGVGFGGLWAERPTLDRVGPLRDALSPRWFRDTPTELVRDGDADYSVP